MLSSNHNESHSPKPITDMLSNTHNESHSPKPYLRYVIEQSQRITLTKAVSQKCYRTITTNHTHHSRISDMLSSTHNASHSPQSYLRYVIEHSQRITHQSRISDMLSNTHNESHSPQPYFRCFRTLTTNHTHHSRISDMLSYTHNESHSPKPYFLLQATDARRKCFKVFSLLECYAALTGG